MSEQSTWWDLAECRGCDPAIFHPSSTSEEALAPGREICRRCDVQVECLTHALNANEPDGIWGGFTAGERKRIRRRRAGRENTKGPIPADVTRPIDHGTYAGAAAHRRRGEQPCAQCLRAAADYEHHTRPSRAETA